MPERVQLRRTKGWRKPADAIVVARPSKWGNPFVVGSSMSVTVRNADGLTEDCVQIPMTRQNAADAFLDLATTRLTAYNADPEEVAYVAQWRSALEELRGHDLACWCPLDQPCHADVLLELANQSADV